MVNWVGNLGKSFSFPASNRMIFWGFLPFLYTDARRKYIIAYSSLSLSLSGLSYNEFIKLDKTFIKKILAVD